MVGCSQSLYYEILHLAQFLMSFLETTKDDLVVRDELATEVRGLINAINRLQNFLLNNMLVRWLRLPQFFNLDLLLQLCHGVRTRFRVQLAEGIVGDVDVGKLVAKVRWGEHALFRGGDNLCLITASSDAEVT